MKYLVLLTLLHAFSAVGQSLTRLSSTAISGNNGLAASGSTVYITGASFALATYDFSQPGTPKLISTVPTNTEYPRAVIASGTKAYVHGSSIGTVSSSSVRVFDMSNPTTPVGGTYLTLGAPYQYIAANGSLVCIASSTEAKLRVYDASLNLLATVNTVAVSNGLTINGSAVYLQQGSRVLVYDVSQPTAPAYVTTTPGFISAVSGNLAAGIDTYNNTFFTSPKTLYVYDVSVPLQPVLKGNVVNNGGALLAMSGNLVYTTGQYFGSSTIGLQAFDVSKPVTPTLLATATVYSSAGALAANGTTVYLADNSMLQAFSLTGVLATSTPASAKTGGLYPNPAHGSVTLAHTPAATPVTIYDATGRVCLQTAVQADNTVDISALTAGLYVARVGTAAHRLLVE